MSDNDKNSENNEYEDMNYNNNINSNYNSDNNEKNERYIQTNEDKDEYILELQNKLKLKDAYIIQLENDYYEKKIKCDCKDELDFIFSNAFKNIFLSLVFSSYIIRESKSLTNASIKFLNIIE